MTSPCSWCTPTRSSSCRAGLAQAQAQRELADLGDLLKGHGVEVSYAIHPVAGRMPGHMNVLLAEANVPYEELIDLDDINPQSRPPTWPWSSAPTT